MLNKELRILKCALVLLLPALLATETTVCAGMPSPLPSQWTAGSGFDGAHTDDSAVALRVQAISFFLAVFAFCDGSVRMVSDRIDPRVVEAMARPDDGLVPRGTR